MNLFYCFILLYVPLTLTRPINEKLLPVELTRPQIPPPPTQFTSEDAEIVRILSGNDNLESVPEIEDTPGLEDEPPLKRPKIQTSSNVDVNPKNSRPEECYFKIKRTTEYETKDRPDTSTVTTECSERLIPFSSFITSGGASTEYGATNEADLILARGAGEYQHDWNDENVVETIGRRYICTTHYNELSANWRKIDHHIIKKDNNAEACSISFPFSHETKITNHVKPRLTHNEAKALLFVAGILVHEGIPVCRTHREYVERTFTSFTTLEANRIIYPPPITGNLGDSENLEADGEVSRAQCEIDETLRLSRRQQVNYKESPVKAGSFKPEPETPVKQRYQCVKRVGPYGEEASCRYDSLMDVLKIQPHSSRKTWKSMTVRMRFKHVAAYKDTVKKMAVLQLGESDADNLMRAANVFEHAMSSGYWNNVLENELLQEISKFYFAAETSSERRNVLSMVADVYPFGMIEQYISGLTSWAYYSAKRAAIRFKNHQMDLPKPNHKPRVKLADLESFIGFVTSEIITTGLPFGNIVKKLPNGRTIEIPSAVRNFRASDIIRMYTNDMNARQLPVKLSESTMRRILDACPAKQKTTLDAVDQFKADGLQAFTWMRDLVDSLLEMNVISNELTKKEYKAKLAEAEFFFKADYYNLLQMEHLSADLCISFALSDPVKKTFRSSKCNVRKNHRYQIQRALIFDNLCTDILMELGEYAKKTPTADTMKLRHLETTVAESQMAIDAWKNHIVRKRYSDKVRADIFDKLGNGEAIITIDFAQKFLPRKSTESLRDYFGKAGLSMHIMHCVVKRFDELKHHTIVHFLGHADQNYIAVTAILISGLKILKEQGVESVTLRSDNAAYYHNAALLMSMPKIGQKTKVNIKRYSFSEAQAGKSTADVETARLKNVIRAHIRAGHDMLSEVDMFHAINEAVINKALYGVTAVVPTKIPVGQYASKKHLIDMSFIGDVEYSTRENGFSMKCWRHYHIGSGMVRHFTDEDTTDLPVEAFEEESLSTPARPFWRSPNMNTAPVSRSQEARTSNNAPKDDGDKGGLYRCPVEGCKKEYITANALDEHMFGGRHEFVTDRETLQETTYKLYADAMTGLLETQRSFISATTDISDVEIRNKKDIKLEGWALKKPKRTSRFKKHVKEFLMKHYVVQMKQGHNRVNAAIVQEHMRKSDDPFFPAAERLTASQIASWYARTSKELKKLLQQAHDDEANNNNDENMPIDPYDRAATISLDAMETEPAFSSTYRKDTTFVESHDRLIENVRSPDSGITVYRDDPPHTHDELL